MKHPIRITPAATLFILLAALLLLSACASTKASDRETYYSGQLPRPGQIIVYDFVATPEGVQPDSALANQDVVPSIPPTADQVELDRKLGMQIADQLKIRFEQQGWIQK